jgi:hypothetical protein
MKTDVMHPTRSRARPIARPCRVVLGILAGAVLLPTPRASAQAPTATATTAAAPADSDTRLPAEQLQSLVAPIALYPDDLLAQTLVASTYPLEIIQLQQWLVKHPGLKDKALADSVAKQPWDPSIQSMAAVPEVVKRLADDIQWTTELGNAFLAQQADVMAAVQVMRKKAKDKGALESNEQQKVKTETVEQQQVIIVESANPEVIYVPTYSPTVVYPPPVYPYPPIYYPPYPPGAAMVSFTVGMMWGAAIWGGACCHAGWGGNNIYINNNNNFNQINHNRGGAGSGNWQHNAEHRGAAPYGDRNTANKYGGSSRGAGVSDRQAGAGQGGRGAGVSDRSTGAGSNRGAGVSDRSAGAASNRGAGVSDRSAGAGGGERVGSRDVPSNRGGGSSGNWGGSSGFSGGSGGYNGASARASSSRGASSMGSRGGGGMSRGGGGGRRR